MSEPSQDVCALSMTIAATCLTFPSCALRRAIEHSPPSDYFHLLKTECHDQNEGFSLNRILRIDRDRAASPPLSRPLKQSVMRTDV